MKSSKKPYYIALGLAGSIALVSVGFFGGMQFQISRGLPGGAFPGQGGPRGSRGAPGGSVFGDPARGGGTIGTVASVNGTSMVVKNVRTGVKVAVSLASNPTITTGSGASGSLSDITSGVTVIVQGSADADGIVQATSILVNPNFGGSGPQAPPQGDGSSSNGGV